MRRALAIAALAVALVVPATAAHASGTASGKPPKLC